MHARGKHFTPAQKADIVRRHLSDKEPVSDLADRFGAQPSQVHNWPGRPRDYSLGLPQIRACASKTHPVRHVAESLSLTRSGRFAVTRW